jgi:hypothetical protein
MTSTLTPPASPGKAEIEGAALEQNDYMAKGPRSPVEEQANSRRGGRRSAPSRAPPKRGADGKRLSVARCATADSMQMKMMQRGLRAALAGKGDDDSERPPSPTDDAPPLSVGILICNDDDSDSSIGDRD